METLVNNGTGAQYSAKDLEDVAGFMEQLATNARTLAEHATTKAGRRFQEGEASAYSHVANVLRRTKLVGGAS